MDAIVLISDKVSTSASFHGRHDYLDVEISLDHLPEIGSTKGIFLMLSVAVVWEELRTEYS